MSRYLTPVSLDQALVDLAARGARPVAGGTDLMVEFRTGRLAGRPHQGDLVEVARLPELAGIREDGDEVVIGAGVTFSQLAESELVKSRLPLLAEAACTVGSKQIRNVATIGGNVANQSPAADGACALVALGAQVELVKAGRARCHPVDELLSPEGLCTLEPGELIMCFRVPKPAAPFGCAFRKIIRRRAVAIARFSAACLIGLSPDKSRIERAAVSLGAVFPSPQAVRAVADALEGTPGNQEDFDRAGQVARDVMLAVSGSRPSMIYKGPAVQRVVAATAATAWRRAWEG